MSLKSPYKVAEIFHKNASSLLQRTRHGNDSKSVILKAFKPSQETLKGFLRDLRTLFLPYIPTKLQSRGTGLRFTVSILPKDLNA